MCCDGGNDGGAKAKVRLLQVESREAWRVLPRDLGSLQQQRSSSIKFTDRSRNAVMVETCSGDNGRSRRC